MWTKKSPQHLQKTFLLIIEWSYFYLRIDKSLLSRGAGVRCCIYLITCKWRYSHSILLRKTWRILSYLENYDLITPFSIIWSSEKMLKIKPVIYAKSNTLGFSFKKYKNYFEKINYFFLYDNVFVNKLLHLHWIISNYLEII